MKRIEFKELPPFAVSYRDYKIFHYCLEGIDDARIQEESGMMTRDKSATKVFASIGLIMGYLLGTGLIVKMGYTEEDFNQFDPNEPVGEKLSNIIHDVWWIVKECEKKFGKLNTNRPN